MLPAPGNPGGTKPIEPPEPVTPSGARFITFIRGHAANLALFKLHWQDSAVTKSTLAGPKARPASLYWPIVDPAPGYSVAMPEKPVICPFPSRVTAI